MTVLEFRALAVLPEGWRPADAQRPSAPFTAGYSDTLEVLDRELRHLRARDVFLQVETPAASVRLDGQLRADARVTHPGVVLTIDSAAFGTLVYDTDLFGRRWASHAIPAWHHNLRAIALGLEALRKVERYGIARRGQQYAGYRELGSGVPMPPAGFASVEEAARFIAEYSDDPAGRLVDVAADPSFATALYREAAKRLHPDAGGDPALFVRLGQARQFLVDTFGGEA